MTKKIRRMMKENKVTLTQVARDLGVTRVWVSYVVNRRGKSTSARVWRAIARAVHRPVGEIMPTEKRKAA
jgi:transcriptional regulator with XRE-family HTH domain